MSNVLNEASLVMIPSGYKEDVVYSQIPTDGSGDLSFTRASNGTRINSAGLVEVTPWNLLQQSETFDNAAWTPNNATITANSTTAPNGTTTADTFTLTPGNDSGVYQAVNGESNNYTTSVYAKYVSGDKYLLFFSPLNSQAAKVWFDIQNGTVSNQLSGFVGTIENAGNGWYKCSMYNTTQSNSTFIQFAISTTNSSRTLSNNSVSYFWGAQVNVGTAKPYFPTTDRLNVPRLTYPVGGGCPSLLLEKQSTNLTLYSDQLDNAVHNNLEFTIAANNITSPDGTQNADKFTETTATDEHIIYDIDSNATGTYTLSAFFKGGAGTIFPVLRLNGADSDQYAGCIFNTSTGAVVNTFYNTYSAPITKVENMGNGWYRVSMTTTTTNTNFGMRIAASNSASPSVGGYGAISYTGNTSNYFYAYGGQLEASSYPTSYIPTTSSSATKVADACFKTGISSLIGQTEGVIYWEGQISSTFNGQLCDLNADGNKFIQIYTTLSGSTPSVGIYIQNVSVLLNSGSIATIAFNTNFKLALGYKNNDYAVYLNGVQVYVNTATAVPPTSNFGIGRLEQTAESAGKSINQALLFKTRLTNAELAALTTL